MVCIVYVAFVLKEFKPNLSLVKETIQFGVTDAYTKQNDKRLKYYAICNPDLFLFLVQDPVPCIQVFATQFYNIRLAPSNKHTQFNTIYLALLGYHDPRYNEYTKINLYLSGQYQSYISRRIDQLLM